MKKTITPAAALAATEADFSNFLVACLPGGIEAQEAQGQRDMVACQALPKKSNVMQEQLAALGFSFGDDKDELFVNAQFPDGWKLVATEHTMHSNLVDQDGNVRAHVFYKAAFYDRRADIRWCRRYSVTEARLENDMREARVIDNKGGAVLFYAPQYASCDYKASAASDLIARAWLEQRYPDTDPLSYW